MAREIPLTKGFTALVDDLDFEEVSKYRWHALIVRSGPGQKVYAARNRRASDDQALPSQLSMHRQLMGYPEKPYEVDHENGNGLDNRRSNLRLATRLQNVRNGSGRRKRGASKYIGVGRKGSRWFAQMGRTIDGKFTCRYLGTFDTEEGAARAYDAAAFDLDPEFCRLNFPQEHQKN